MRRHMKLIRMILEFAELNAKREPMPDPEFKDYTPEDVRYHIGLCREAGYLHLQKLPRHH